MGITDDIAAQLTGPGGPFEVVQEDVEGVTMKVYKDRLPSLRDVLALGCALHADKDYLVYGDERIDFATFARQANAVSAGLAAAGVAPGDRVAVLSANNPAWVQAFWGTVQAGMVLVGLNGWWKADEVVYGLEDSGSVVLVADGPRFERVASDLAGLAGLRAVYLVGADPTSYPDAPAGLLHRFEELLVDLDAPAPTAPIDEGDPAVIFYTSGTTGRPKGAISTHRNMVANLQNTVYNAMAGAMIAAARGEEAPPSLDAATQNAALLTSPLFHVSGCHSGIVVAALAGIKDVIPVGRFDPETAMRLIAEEKVTVWATVPTMVWRVVEHPDRHAFDLTSVTSIAYGGSPSAAELQRRIQETFPNVRSMGNAYGLTESSSAATVNGGQDLLDRPDSVGRPMPTVDIKVVDPSGEEVPTGAVGEICIKGPIVMPGYWGKPEATAEALAPGGWLRSGDLGYVDEDGFLYVTDRAKDMLIRGGENVYCVEIENRLAEHPAIAEAAVIGVPHPTLGEEVKAVLRLEEGASITDDEVRAFVAETLASFKVPAYIERHEGNLPRNASGKLLKNVLRGEGVVSFAETM